MNRQKKIKQINKKRMKKEAAKRAPKKKSTYISKAKRAELEELEQSGTESEQEWQFRSNNKKPSHLTGLF